MKLSVRIINRVRNFSDRYFRNINDDIRAIEEIFDANFYRKTYAGLKGNDYELARDYLTRGWLKGRDPAASFSTLFYLKANPDVQQSGFNPLLHYVRFGKSENRAIAASAIMDLKHGDNQLRDSHRKDFNLSAINLGQNKLARLFSRAHPDSIKISPWFDFAYYESSFSNNNVPRDLASHYLRKGWKEGRDPAPWFSTRHYLARHQDVAVAGNNPFVHYCLSGIHEGRELTKLGRNTDDLYRAHQSATSPGSHFEEFDPKIGIGRRKLAKALAFYLPQYHAVEVNDLHWGQGFTEWRNISRALPRFKGHIQPRVPRDMGFYDLSKDGVMRQQVEMAKDAGIHGFCFYHYWFNGVRTLEAPMERFLQDQSIDFPFCIMWTNENWTRTWDGAESEIILQQDYDPLNDQALVADFARHMNDPRYIRLAGRPLLFIYRPGHIPDAKEAIKRWRFIFEDEHQLLPLIFMAQGFGDIDPRDFGLDGAIEFPPHKLAQGLSPINAALDWYDDEYKGHVFDYDAMVERSLAEEATEFPLIKTATPSWDNEARRPGRGMVMHGSTPRKFEAWVSSLVARAQTDDVFDEPMICINAWNEWCEGAVLEPDVHYGGAFLNAVSRAVHGATSSVPQGKSKVLSVGHVLREISVVGAAFDLDFYLSSYPDIANAEGVDPVEHYCLYGWKEHRDPTPDFSTRYYLEAYPDVRDAGINPFFHYLSNGKDEGRITNHPGGYVAATLTQMVPLEEVVAATSLKPAPEKLILGDDLYSNLSKASKQGAKGLMISISHDNYREISGGVQYCLQREEVVATERGFTYLHLSPYEDRRCLAPADTGSDALVTVVLDGRAIGVAQIGSVIESVRQISDSFSEIEVVVHHLMGHSPEQIAELVRATGYNRCWMWLHDSFTLCPSHALQRNNVAFCGAPAPSSNACILCSYGKQRLQHHDRMLAFFDEFSVHVIAPSKFTADFWSKKTSLTYASLNTSSHMTLEFKKLSTEKPASDGPITIAFVGFPGAHKGWPVFESILREVSGNQPGLRFAYFGVSEVRKKRLKTISTQVTAEDPNAMINALAEEQVDFVLHWATCAETFSFSTHEALAAGAYVLTNSGSGNVAAVVKRRGCGVVFDDEADLRAFFKDGRIEALSEEVRAKRSARTARLTYSNMTFSVMDRRR